LITVAPAHASLGARQAACRHTVPRRHGRPQAPQLLLSLAVLTSQPSPGVPLQSAKPALHDPIAHWVADCGLHTGVALGKEHALPHA
jgi:hypothetical protein